MIRFGSLFPLTGRLVELFVRDCNFLVEFGYRRVSTGKWG
jgi:hypothetical protein